MSELIDLHRSCVQPREYDDINLVQPSAPPQEENDLTEAHYLSAPMLHRSQPGSAPVDAPGHLTPGEVSLSSPTFPPPALTPAPAPAFAPASASAFASASASISVVPPGLFVYRGVSSHGSLPGVHLRWIPGRKGSTIVIRPADLDDRVDNNNLEQAAYVAHHVKENDATHGYAWHFAPKSGAPIGQPYLLFPTALLLSGNYMVPSPIYERLIHNEGENHRPTFFTSGRSTQRRLDEERQLPNDTKLFEVTYDIVTTNLWFPRKWEARFQYGRHSFLWRELSRAEWKAESHSLKDRCHLYRQRVCFDEYNNNRMVAQLYMPVTGSLFGLDVRMWIAPEYAHLQGVLIGSCFNTVMEETNVISFFGFGAYP